MGNDGVTGMGRDGWRRVKTSRKEKDIGVMKKGRFWAREEKELCPGGATCLPMLGNVLAPLGQAACPKTGQKMV